MKKTEFQRLEDEMLIFEDNREILNQFLRKLIKSFVKRYDDMDIELKDMGGVINPEHGTEIHKITLVAKRQFDAVSKGVVNSYKTKKHREAQKRQR